MVTSGVRTAIFVLGVLVVISADGSGVTASVKKAFCISSTFEFGQKSHSIWCREDSCYLMKFTASSASRRGIGLYGIPVDKARRLQGDSLMSVIQQTRNWIAKRSSSSLSVSRGGGPVTSIPRHPGNQKGLAGLSAWELSLISELEAHPIWTDSLLLKKGSAGSNSISISLVSKGGMERWVGSEGKGKTLFSNQKSGLGNPWNQSWDGEDTLSRECTERILAGKICDFPLGKNGRTVKVILRVTPDQKAIHIPDVCLDGRFEWVAVRSE
jgi:hypothetical protein